MANGLDHFVTSAPGRQNALNIFEGQWTSQLPHGGQGLTAGSIPLIQDPRVTWAIERLGGVQDRMVLELGSLEGGHSYMLENGGAKSLLAPESSSNSQEPACARCGPPREPPPGDNPIVRAL